MEFIIFFDDQNKAGHLKSVLESTFTCKVTSVDSYATYVQSLESNFYDLNIFNSNKIMTSSELEKTKRFKNLFIVKGTSQNYKNLKSITDVDFLIQEDEGNVQEIFHNISKIFKIKNEQKVEESIEYYPLRLSYLSKISVAPTDIFIKLSEHKFLKFIRKNTSLTPADFEHVLNKNVDTLYIHQSEFEDFISSVNFDNGENEVDSMVYAQEIFQHFSSKVGLNEKAMNSANKAMNVLFDYIDEEPQLKKMWDYLMKNKSPMAEHSLMVGYLSAGMLTYTKFNNDNNSIKLTLAAILHDSTIVLEDKFLYELKGLDKDVLSKKEIDRFKDHVNTSLDLLDKFENAPMDVDKILLNHHEKYDGTGFPRGLNASKIPFLSSIFIVAHEFVIEMMNHSFDKNIIDNFIQTKLKLYVEGSFKEAIEALSKSV